MGLIRFAIIAVLLYLAWRVIKKLMAPAQPSAPARKSQDTQAMIKCAQCGVHVPAPEAFSHNNQHFCSQEHMRIYLAHHDD